jgi:hypothetical protein
VPVVVVLVAVGVSVVAPVVAVADGVSVGPPGVGVSEGAVGVAVDTAVPVEVGVWSSPPGVLVGVSPPGTVGVGVSDADDVTLPTGVLVDVGTDVVVAVTEPAGVLVAVGIGVSVSASGVPVPSSGVRVLASGVPSDGVGVSSGVSVFADGVPVDPGVRVDGEDVRVWFGSDVRAPCVPVGCGFAASTSPAVRDIAVTASPKPAATSAMPSMMVRDEKRREFMREPRGAVNETPRRCGTRRAQCVTVDRSGADTSAGAGGVALPGSALRP